MEAFRPKPAHQIGRFVVEFGPPEREVILLVDDVPDALLNRVAVNCAALTCGVSGGAGLDALSHRVQAALNGRKPTGVPESFWARAGTRGSPRLRLEAQVGKRTSKLSHALSLIGPGAAEIERVRRWPIWALIHPDPFSWEELRSLEERTLHSIHIEDWCHLTDCSVPTDVQSARIRQATGDEARMDLALNALWMCLRRSVVAADLPRYAALYHAWIDQRSLLDVHPWFKRSTPALFQFTAYWFGQVELLTDRSLRPLSSERLRYVAFIDSTLAALRPTARAPSTSLNDACAPFVFGATTTSAGLKVRPSVNIKAHYLLSEGEADFPVTEYWEAWPDIAASYNDSRFRSDSRPGLTQRPDDWRTRYGHLASDEP